MTYENETFYFNGRKLTPTTDVIHETVGNMYTNEVTCSGGKLYRVYYTQEDLDNDRWDEPCGLWEISQEELNIRSRN